MFFSSNFCFSFSFCGKCAKCASHNTHRAHNRPAHRLHCKPSNCACFICSFSHGIPPNDACKPNKIVVTAPHSEWRNTNPFEPTKTICHTQTLLSRSHVIMVAGAMEATRVPSHLAQRNAAAASAHGPRNNVTCNTCNKGQESIETDSYRGAASIRRRGKRRKEIADSISRMNVAV